MMMECEHAFDNMSQPPESSQAWQGREEAKETQREEERETENAYRPNGTIPKFVAGMHGEEGGKNGE